MTEILSHMALLSTVQYIFTKQLPWPLAYLLSVIPKRAVRGSLIYLHQRQVKYSLLGLFSGLTLQKQAWLGVACVPLSIRQAKHLFTSTYEHGITHKITQFKKKKKSKTPPNLIHNEQLCHCKNCNYYFVLLIFWRKIDNKTNPNFYPPNLSQVKQQDQVKIEYSMQILALHSRVLTI